MCGIIGCVNDEAVAPILLRGLKRVEYRGYDSAGLATVSESVIRVRKAAGRIDDIERKYGLSTLSGTTGIAHTRWATHGGVTDRNAHPHTSCKEMVAIVHNGIIENYLELKKQLRPKGHISKSETDSEVTAHLIEAEYRQVKDPVKATILAAKRLKGQYAFASLFQGCAELINGARKDAPLLIGVGDTKNFIASDVLAFIEHTDRTIFLDNQEVVKVTNRSVEIFDMNGRPLKRKPTQVAWELADLSKMDYAHYTLKEIHEQPKTVVSAMMQNEEKLAEFVEKSRGARSVFVTAAGTSYHAGLLLKYRLERDAAIWCEVTVAGEFREDSEFVDGGSVVIALSQSGETADLLEAIREARKRGAKILSLVNATGSTLARESDLTLLLNCGPEVGVAATKSFTAQVVVANLIVDNLVGSGNGGGEEVAGTVEEALSSEPTVKEIARSEEHTSELQSRENLVCRLLLEK